MTEVQRRSHIRTDIQGLRGVAVLIGLAYHAGFELSGGYIAFDIFFVVSGYVIAGMLGRELARSGRINLAAFYARRFRRLIPALVVVVAVTVVASGLLLSPTQPQHTVYTSAFGALLLYANHAVPTVSGDYFAADAKLNPLLHTWSLSLEEQVYLVFPALLLIGWFAFRRRPRSRVNPTVVILVTCAISFCFATASSDGQSVLGLPVTLGGYHGPASRFWEFGIGGLASLHSDRLRSLLPSRLRAVLAVVATLSLFVLVFLLNEAAPYPDVITLWPVAAIVSILLAEPTSFVPATLSNHFLVHIGDISYSWYLWHWPIISLTDSLTDRRWVIVVAALLSYAPARLSYRWLEVPFTSGMPQLKAMPRFVAAVLVPPLAITTALAVAVNAGYWSPDVEKFQAADRPHLPQAQNCGLPTAPLCSWNAGATGPPVYLAGDSVAEQYAEGVVAAASANGRSVLNVTRGGCPLIDLRVWSGSGIDHGVNLKERSDSCVDATRLAFDIISAGPTGTVVMAFSSDYLFDDEVELIADSTGPDVEQDLAKVEVLTQAVRRTAAAYVAAGHAVVIGLPMPELPRAWGPRRCNVRTMLVGGCSFQISNASATNRVSTLRSALQTVVFEMDLEVFDPVAHLCSQNWCNSEYNGEVLYRDAGHISVAASQRMTSEWQNLLRPFVDASRTP